MILKKGKSYFLSVTEVVLRANADKKSEALNHLIFGDWLRYLGKEQNDWISIHCRGHDGWILKGCISEERP